MKIEAPPCRAIVMAQGKGLYSVAFELMNHGDAPVSLSTFEPFLQFQLRAEADGRELAVSQPTLDVGLQRKPQGIEAHGSLKLQTPLRLQLSASAPPSTDRFTWSIAHEPVGLSLVFSLDLPAPFDQPCRATLEGG